MATKNSDLYAKQANPILGNRVRGDNLTPTVLMLIATYTMLGTEAANDIIDIVKLPQGTMIVPHLCQVVGDGIATTATLDVGDDDVLGVGSAADADRYADGLDVAAAGSDLFSAIASAANTVPYRLGSDAIIKGLFATMNTPVAGKKLVFRIAYLALV